MSQYRDQRIAFPVFFHRRGCTGFLFNQENLYETEESKNEFGKKT